MDENCVGPGGDVLPSARQRFGHARSGDQGFKAGNHHELSGAAGAFGGLDLAGKLPCRHQVVLAGQEAVGLGPAGVFQADGRDIGLFE